MLKLIILIQVSFNLFGADLSSKPEDTGMAKLKTECASCMDKDSSCLFMPCGHLNQCQDCTRSIFRVARTSGTVARCPLCRGTIERVYTVDQSLFESAKEHRAHLDEAIGPGHEEFKSSFSMLTAYAQENSEFAGSFVKEFFIASIESEGEPVDLFINRLTLRLNNLVNVTLVDNPNEAILQKISLELNSASTFVKRLKSKLRVFKNQVRNYPYCQTARDTLRGISRHPFRTLGMLGALTAKIGLVSNGTTCSDRPFTPKMIEVGKWQKCGLLFCEDYFGDEIGPKTDAPHEWVEVSGGSETCHAVVAIGGIIELFLVLAGDNDDLEYLTMTDDSEALCNTHFERRELPGMRWLRTGEEEERVILTPAEACYFRSGLGVFFTTATLLHLVNTIEFNPQWARVQRNTFVRRFLPN